jgi:hypothetical protein
VALIRWGFEVGANNDAMSLANAAGDSVFTGGGTATISTALAFDGSRSMLMTGTSTSGTVYVSKNFPDTTHMGADVFINITSMPTAEAALVLGLNGTTRNFSLAINVTGQLRIRNGASAGGVSVWTSTNTLSLNTWYRVSIYATQDPTNGTIQAAFYAGNSSTAIEDSTLITGQNTGSSTFNSVRFGVKPSSNTVQMTAYFDSYGYDYTATGLLPAAVTTPALAFAYNINSPPAAAIPTTLTTGSFTPAIGEIIVLKASTETEEVVMGTPSATGGGITWTKQIENTSKSTSYGVIWTGTITAGGSTITMSMTTSNATGLATSGVCSMTIERWAGAQLASTPVTVAAVGGSTTSTITTTAANSIVSYVDADWDAVVPTGKTYASSAIEDGFQDASPSTVVSYYAYQTAATAGSQTFGLTAPSGRKDTLLGIEVQVASVVTPVAHNLLIMGVGA